eukprot:6200248-Pleurochrysis_carterae.AAC.3
MALDHFWSTATLKGIKVSSPKPRPVLRTTLCRTHAPLRQRARNGACAPRRTSDSTAVASVA